MADNNTTVTAGTKRRKRRTFADIRKETRCDAIAEACRHLKHKMGMAEAADELWTAMGYRHNG